MSNKPLSFHETIKFVNLLALVHRNQPSKKIILENDLTLSHLPNVRALQNIHNFLIFVSQDSLEPGRLFGLEQQMACWPWFPLILHYADPEPLRCYNPSLQTQSKHGIVSLKGEGHFHFTKPS